MHSTMNQQRREAIRRRKERHTQFQRELVQTAGHGARAAIMANQAALHQEMLALAFYGMTDRQKYIAGAIRYHMVRNNGAVPAYATLRKLNIQYEEADETFNLLHENGGIEWVKVPSKGKTNRMMTTLALTF